MLESHQEEAMQGVVRRSKLLTIGLATLMLFVAGAEIAEAREPQEAQEAQQEQEARQEQAATTNGDIVVARNLAELPEVVTPGETVIVTDATGARDKFKMHGVSADNSTLYLKRGDEIVSLREDEVLNVVVRRSDSLWNGAIKGGLIGASPLVVAAIICTAVDGCASEALAASLFTGLIGAGIGAGIDASIKEESLIYSAAGVPGRQKIVVAPMLSKNRQGLMVTVRF